MVSVPAQQLGDLAAQHDGTHERRSRERLEQIPLAKSGIRQRGEGQHGGEEGQHGGADQRQAG